MQHCASYRSGGSGGSGGGGWRFCSGHEFLLLYPHQCRGTAWHGTAAAARHLTSSGGGSGSSDSDMGDASAAAATSANALVIDPEFSTQFALAAPTARYQVGNSWGAWPVARLPASLPGCIGVWCNAQQPPHTRH